MARPRADTLVLGTIATLAAANFLWHLDSPSLFVDEALSWGAAAAGSPADVLSAVRDTEISPPGHYLGLRAWIIAFGSDEWVMRLPSVLAGLALVFVVYRIGLVVFGRFAALVAALLTATSPYVVTYAQQARAYVFVMLLVGLAVLAAFEAERAASARKRHRWLAGSVVAGVAAFWTHYTAALVLGPLLVWIASRPVFGERAKTGVWGCTLLSWALAAPLLGEQLSQGHQAGIAASARLTLENAVQVIGTPFEDRTWRVTGWLVAGAVSLVVAAVVVGILRGPRSSRVRLLLAAAGAPLVAVFAVTAVSDDVLISRYTAVAAPFLLLLLAGAIAIAPRPLAVALVAVAVVAAVAGGVRLHGSSGFYPDVRAVFHEIDRDYRRGDRIMAWGYPAIGPLTEYYRVRVIPEAPPVLQVPHQGHFEQAREERRRLWLITDAVASPGDLRRALTPLRYRPTAARAVPAVVDLQVVRAVPSP